MPTPEARRARRRIDLSLALAVLIGFVVAMGGLARYLDSRSADRHTDVVAEQRDTIKRSREGCVRSLTDRAEGIQRDRDLAAFLTAAAAARRAEGMPAVAAEYERIARRANARERSARGRMLGANPAASRIAHAAPVACARAYPLPPQ